MTLIIPLYNAGAFVERCTAMCIAQTLDNIEIIFVDDCSTDSTRADVESFIGSYRGDKRFVLVSTSQNSGPGAARNLGLSKAQGEYVCFVDCDDEIEPDYCKKFYSTAKWYDADIVCCNATCNGKVLRSPYYSGDVEKTVRKQILRTFVTYLWTYAFRRDFLVSEGIHFPSSRSCEDTCFLACAWLSAAVVAHIDEVLYIYQKHSSSLSSIKTRERCRWRVASMGEFYRYAVARHKGGDYLPEILWIMLKKGYVPALIDFFKNL